MFGATNRISRHSSVPSGAALALAALLVASGSQTLAQHSETPAPAVPPAPSAPSTPVAPAPAAAPAASEPKLRGDITEEQLKQMLVGKTFYLRGGYLDISLAFNERGALTGHSPQGSYTLSLFEVDHVRLAKHKVEIEGVRYGLHFLGALPSEDPTKAADKVRITPKKKFVRITIDREVVIKPKKVKPEKPGKGQAAPPATPASTPAAVASAPAARAPAPPDTSTAASSETEPSDADQLKAEVGAAPEADRPADLKSVTTTTSAAHAAQVLIDALDAIFAPGLDERMMAAMPDFWKLYYQAVAARADFRPTDPAVQRQNTVDKKARLLTTFEPQSNQFAQDNGVAGVALYHAVIGADGKPQEIAVARPIGFGLDENAVTAIRNAKFEPAIKDGKPVPVLLDLVVQFRIYSKRTSVTASPETANKPAESSLPGPYSVSHPR